MSRKKARKPPPRSTRIPLTVRVARLEMAKGHDGLLRGEPEPVVLLGVYLAQGGVVRPLGRNHVRFSPRSPYPVVVTPNGTAAIEMAILPGEARLVLLAIALEEDDGGDVERLYGALQTPETFACWRPEERVPSPIGLTEAAAWTDATKVFLLEEGDDLRARCSRDELIGATLAVLPATRGKHELRLPFASQRNDWLAVVVVATGSSR